MILVRAHWRILLYESLKFMYSVLIKAFLFSEERFSKQTVMLAGSVCFKWCVYILIFVTLCV